MKQTRLEWKRAQKTRWIAEGFAMAREQAAAICIADAERIDRRNRIERALNHRPKEAAWRLLQAAHKITTMPRPAALPKHDDIDEAEE